LFISPARGEALSFRQRLTWGAHLFKALFYQYHTEFAECVAPFLPEDGVIVDVGAHSGQFAKLFSRLVPKGKVYAFEPGGYALSILRPVIKLRRLKNVTLVSLGLSDEEGQEVLSAPLKKRGTVGFGLAHIGPESRGVALAHEIRLVTLDSFMAGEDLRRLDLIKVDIEGWEVRCLRGAIGTIEQFRPMILVEVTEETLGRVGHSAEEIFDMLAPFGYRIFKLHQNGRCEMEEVEAFTGGADYFFIPKAHAGFAGRTIDGPAQL
jgi:FkbM family methyltransferase